jgi:hypothetical protein
VKGDGRRGDACTLDHRQTPCWPPLGCLHSREYATRTVDDCHWSNHTAVLNKFHHCNCRARAAIKRRRQSAISNAPHNAVYHQHSLRDVERRESEETEPCCDHAEFTPPERACASHKWRFVTSKSRRRSQMAANAHSSRGPALHSFQLHCTIQSW